MTASTMLLNQTGDFTLEWDESKSDRMEQWIEAKMKEGYSFFVVERSFFGLRKKKKAISELDDLKERQVKISDDDMARLAGTDQELFKILSDQTVIPTQNPDKGAPMNTVRRARTPREAARTHTVAVRPLAGG